MICYLFIIMVVLEFSANLNELKREAPNKFLLYKRR